MHVNHSCMHTHSFTRTLTRTRTHTHIFLPYCMYVGRAVHTQGHIEMYLWEKEENTGTHTAISHELADYFLFVRWFWLKQFIERNYKIFYLWWLVQNVKIVIIRIELTEKKKEANVVSFMPYFVLIFSPLILWLSSLFSFQELISMRYLISICHLKTNEMFGHQFEEKKPSPDHTDKNKEKIKFSSIHPDKVITIDSANR